MISGDRDIRTPRVTAEEIVSAAPNATLLAVDNHGHSALDTAQAVSLDAIQLTVNTSGGVPHQKPNTLVAPRSAMARLLAARLALARARPKALS